MLEGNILLPPPFQNGVSKPQWCFQLCFMTWVSILISGSSTRFTEDPICLFSAQECADL